MLFAAVQWFLYRTRAGLVLRARRRVAAVGARDRLSGHRASAIAAVLFGGACAGLGGAYLAVAYTPSWVEGMTAGRGWIALALVVFATWKPWRVLVGAYLFGGVTLAQFQAQALGVDDPVAVPVDAAVRRDDRRARDHLARRDDDPAERARLARQAVPSGCAEIASTLRSVKCAVAGPATASPAPALQENHDDPHHPQDDARGAGRVRDRARAARRRAGAKAGEPLKIGFVYVSPIGDAGWTYQHDIGRKQMEKALGGKVTTKYIESVPEGADAERVIRELAQSGPQADLHDVVRLHEPDDQGRAAVPERASSSTRPATRRRRTSAPTTRASTRAAISPASSPAR